MIEKMTTAQEFIDSYPRMKEIPLAVGSARLLLSMCLSGEYSGLKLVLNKKIVGYVFYYIDGKTCKIIGLWCKNNFVFFRDGLYKYAEGLGCNKVRGISNLSDRAYREVMGMKKVYTVYERKIGG